MPKTKSRKLSLRELSALLAGLRLLQHSLDPVPGGTDVGEIYDCGGRVKGLTVDEINDLCEKINSTDWCSR